MKSITKIDRRSEIPKYNDIPYRIETQEGKRGRKEAYDMSSVAIAGRQNSVSHPKL